MTDKLQQPRQCEESIARDAPGAERAMKIKAGTFLKDGLRSGRHAELDVAVCGPNSNQRIEK